MSLPLALRVASLATLMACTAACTRACRDANNTPNVEVSTTPTLKRPSAAGDAAQPANKTAAAVGASNARSALGYNMDLPGDWSLLAPFLDLMHDARVWEAGSPEATAKLVLDEQGIPKRLGPNEGATAIIHTGETPEFLGHTWVLAYEGKGVLRIDGGVQVLDERPGRTRFRGKGDNVWLSLQQTDPADHIRNIRVFREDREQLLNEGKIFNPDLLDFLAPFGSLRFMDWAHSNEPEQAQGIKWSERSKLSQPQWLRQYIDPTKPALGVTRGGYPVETLVTLANELGTDAHFHMPYKFEDEYVREYAKVVRDSLASNLIATVEYSNEVWNWGFPQATYAREQAEKLWPGEGSGWVQYMGMRASRMCTIWKEVFAGQLHRLRCVIAPQTGWPDLAVESLECPRWVAQGHEPCYKAADAVAITGYFSGRLQTAESAKVVKGWLAKGKENALGKAFRQLEYGDVKEITEDGNPAVGEKSDSLQRAIELFRAHKAIADKFGLELYVYEGGTHFDHGNDEEHKKFLLEIVHDDRMRVLYGKLFAGFRDTGGTIFNVWGGIGPDSVWTNARTLNDRTHPKYRAEVEFAQSSPCWWTDCDRSKRH